MAIIAITIYLFIPKSPKIIECQTDSDCVPISCCHPNSCVSKDQEPNCEDRLCSMSCEGPLDCGMGSCGCQKNKCTVIPSNE